MEHHTHHRLGVLTSSSTLVPCSQKEKVTPSHLHRDLCLHSLTSLNFSCCQWHRLNESGGRNKQLWKGTVTCSGHESLLMPLWEREAVSVRGEGTQVGGNSTEELRCLQLCTLCCTWGFSRAVHRSEVPFSERWGTVAPVSHLSHALFLSPCRPAS